MPIVGDLLSGRDPLTLSSAASVLQAARLMTEAKVKAVLVTSADGAPHALVGIFTEHDLMTRVVALERDPRAVRLGDVMTREIFTVARTHKVADVRRELQSRHISHLPIVEAGAVIGLLSLRDVLRADLEEKAHEVAELEGYFLGGAEPGGI